MAFWNAKGRQLKNNFFAIYFAFSLIYANFVA